MLIIEKKRKIADTKKFILDHKDARFLFLTDKENTFYWIKLMINICEEIDKNLIVEIGKNFFYISDYNSQQRCSQQNFISSRTYDDIIKENFEW